MADQYLIVGLGNPGKRYTATRHNIGFRVLESLANLAGVDYTKESKFFGEIAKCTLFDKETLLLKPTTYMNVSGKSLGAVLNFYKIPVERVLVVVDDVHLDFGVLRVRAKGTSGGHNGLKSIESALGTTEYPRLRMGVGPFDPTKQELDEFVLDAFSSLEEKQMNEFIQKSLQAVEIWLKEGITRAMDLTNRGSSNPSNGE